ncbi:MAG: hypothetical protein L0K03_07575, partial [Bifidobacterium crudilactis]|jgi:succinyl-CoA synthetase beta subunit|nr:hypothetical protein [Bifidobacterium crudilactis]
MSRSLSIVLSDPQVASVLINIYGGITRCDVVAEGILAALQTLNSAKAIVIRFDGNGAKDGLETIAAAQNPRLHVAPTMEEAAQLAASLASQLSGVSLGSLPEDAASIENSQEGR